MADVMKAAPVDLDIQSRILTIRGVQVMLDRDLAELYGVPTKALNQAVKRNLERFPDGFMLSLSKTEMHELVTNCDRFVMLKHSAAPARAFTEQGVAMLSAVLKSATAISVSVQIMQTFVQMRRTLATIGTVLERIEASERCRLVDQARNEERFEKIFDAMNDKAFPPQKVFYDGAVFDADAFATRYILSAKKSILLIDNYVDVVTLEMLAKKRRGVMVEIVTSRRGNRLSESDVEKFNAQYGGLAIRTSEAFHDRFLIVDDCRLYLFGASLKDLGKKCFAFTKLDAGEIAGIKARI